MRYLRYFSYHSSASLVVLLLRTKPNPMWLIAAGAVAGVDVLVTAGLDRSGGIAHVAHHHMPVVGQCRVSFLPAGIAELGEQREIGLERGAVHVQLYHLLHSPPPLGERRI